MDTMEAQKSSSLTHPSLIKVFRDSKGRYVRPPEGEVVFSAENAEISRLEALVADQQAEIENKNEMLAIFQTSKPNTFLAVGVLMEEVSQKTKEARMWEVRHEQLTHAYDQLKRQKEEQNPWHDSVVSDLRKENYKLSSQVEFLTPYRQGYADREAAATELLTVKDNYRIAVENYDAKIRTLEGQVRSLEARARDNYVPRDEVLTQLVFAAENLGLSPNEVTDEWERLYGSE
jgi:chromosome segregation ATPase